MRFGEFAAAHRAGDGKRHDLAPAGRGGARGRGRRRAARVGAGATRAAARGDEQQQHDYPCRKEAPHALSLTRPSSARTEPGEGWGRRPTRFAAVSAASAAAWSAFGSRSAAAIPNETPKTTPRRGQVGEVELVDHPPDRRPRRGLVATGEDDGELVAADPERLLVEPTAAEAAGDGAQHFVPDDVAEAVVDRLEAVEVEQAERQVAAVPRRLRGLLREPRLVGAPVLQPGQVVVAALVGREREPRRVVEVGGQRAAEQPDRLAVALVEGVGAGGEGGQRAELLVAVDDRRAEQRARPELLAGGRFDPRVELGVVAGQHLAALQRAPGEARVARVLPADQPLVDAGPGAEDQVVAVGRVDQRPVGADQVGHPVDDHLHRPVLVEVARGDLSLRLDDLQ